MHSPDRSTDGHSSLNNGRTLSPWKIPSKISLKRIQHKINADLSHSNLSAGNAEKNATKSNGKRGRLLINKFALARAISTPMDDGILPEKSAAENEHLLAKLQQIAAAASSSPGASSDPSSYHSTMRSFSFEQTFASTADASTRSPVESIAEFPVDWSLKSFLRFSTSKASSLLVQLTKLRSIDESQALDSLCSSTMQIENPKALFRALTSFWSYPHLPWLKLFPRSQQNLSASGAPLDELSQQALQDEWKVAFQSLFQSFRTKFSPFFYLCTHTLNVLFREDRENQLLVVITPTTSGFRSTLEKEGIEFAMAE